MPSKWSGTFWSTQYSFFYFWTLVRGVIETTIHEDKPSFSSRLKITYKSIYSYSVIKEGEIVANGNTMTANLNNYAIINNRPVSIPSTNITFNITSRTDDAIKGTYLLHGPHDVGTFEIHRC